MVHYTARKLERISCAARSRLSVDSHLIYDMFRGKTFWRLHCSVLNSRSHLGRVTGLHGNNFILLVCKRV